MKYGARRIERTITSMAPQASQRGSHNLMPALEVEPLTVRDRARARVRVGARVQLGLGYTCSRDRTS